MPLQNRVDPFGELFAGAARGLFMGNRGGRVHTIDRTLGARRWASRQWICCRLEWKGNRQRFPRGVDVILAAPGGIACLPRTTRISVMEG